MTVDTGSSARSYFALVMAALFVLLGIWGGNLLTRRFSRTLSGAILLPCRPDQDIQIMGDKTLYYDGSQLRALDKDGRIAFNRLLGGGYSYEASQYGVATFKENLLTLVDVDGEQVYTQRLDKPILRARQGEVYTAVHIGTELSGDVVIVDKTGKSIDRIALNRQVAVDMGFFSTTGDMLYIMLLDIEGTVPRCTINMYKPAKMMTGSIADSDQLIYAALYNQNQVLAVGTNYVRAYDYTGKEIKDQRELVYGWQLKDARTSSGNARALIFAKTAQTQGAPVITDVRVLQNGESFSVHYPVECFATFGGERSFYGFSRLYAFACEYGKQRVGTMILPRPADNILGINAANQALLVSGEEVYLLPLP